MPTFKTLVLPNSNRSDGTYNIKIRVVHNRKNTKISTQWNVEKDDLRKDKDGKILIKNTYFVELVEGKINEYRKICNGTPNIDTMTLKEVVELLKSSQRKSMNITESTSIGALIDTLNSKDKIDFKLDFIEYLRSEYKRLLKLGRKKKKSAMSQQTVANSLQKFIKTRGMSVLDVNDLTAKFVQNYIDYLKGDDEHHTRKCTAYPGTISKALNELKYRYNDEDSGIVKITVNPFEKIKQGRRSGVGKLKLKKKNKRPALTIEQIQTMIDLRTFDTKREELARDMFLLSFMLIGINSADLYYCSDRSKNILTYYREKVEERREDDGLMKVKIEPEVKPLFRKYKNLNRTKSEVFHFSTMYANHENFNKAINKGLDNIDGKIGVPNIQYYSARRSWATIARNKVKTNKANVAEALNHIDDDLKTLDLYIDKDFSIAWEINRAVLDFFDWDNLMNYHKSEPEEKPKKVKKK